MHNSITYLNSQKKYFNSEFSKVNSYKLGAWQKKYITRIKKSFLKKDFKNKILIDIAAGHGYVSVEMAKIGLKVTALDISKESIKNITEYKDSFILNNLKVLHSRAEKVPIASKSADYVVANAILEHIPNEKKAINEWLRIIKPGGRLFVTVPLSLKYIWPFFWIINLVHDRRIGHLRRYDLESLTNKFGLKVIKVYYSGHFLKMIWFIVSFFVKNKKIDSLIEKIDVRKSSIKYGSSNISVIFEK